MRRPRPVPLPPVHRIVGDGSWEAVDTSRISLLHRISELEALRDSEDSVEESG